MNMKYILLTTCVFLQACALTATSGYKMQPDGSYVINAGGNVIASSDLVKGEAQRTAQILCPKGYQEKATVPYSHVNEIDLIVKCDE